MSPNRSSGSSGGSDEQPGGALSHPSQLTQADPERLSALTRDAEASRETLRAVLSNAGAEPRDRVAAAVLLEAVLSDSGAIDALDDEAAASTQALELRFAPALRPAAAQALGTPATVQLLSWAAQSSPGAPPVEAAEAAAHLGVDDDGRIYGRVSQRAVQNSEQKGLSRALKDRLRRLTDALGLADQQARRQRAEQASAGEDTAAAGDSTPQAPAHQEDPGAQDLDRRDGSAPQAAQRRGDSGPPDRDHQDDPAPSWTSDDDSALASMLGREPDDDPVSDRPRPSGEASTQPPQAPDFGRPVGFDGGNAAAFGQPSGSEEDVPRARQGSGPGYGPGSGTTEGQPPRSYDFRYLGDETPKPTTEAEKAEFRTTLRNWGIFALALVLVMIIVAIIL
ncbi:hypothetical protein [Kocuria palustris]|uniref:hypothetical protein n=2 Tax=Micrococcales TaxID=85006 RepID=UPI0024698518|nr:hypothetical protein [Kocuria palustris]MDH5152277.1 hypothetical protein [Kocuria palustris]